MWNYQLVILVILDFLFPCVLYFCVLSFHAIVWCIWCSATRIICQLLIWSPLHACNFDDLSSSLPRGWALVQQQGCSIVTWRPWIRSMETASPHVEVRLRASDLLQSLQWQEPCALGHSFLCSLLPPLWYLKLWPDMVCSRFMNMNNDKYCWDYMDFLLSINYGYALNVISSTNQTPSQKKNPLFLSIH